jgi:hypothetical protein
MSSYDSVFATQAKARLTLSTPYIREAEILLLR